MPVLLDGVVGVYGGADDAHFVGGGDDFEAAALQGTHLDHFEEQAVEQVDVDEAHFGSANEKGSRALHVDAGGGGGGQGAMAEGDKFLAASVAGARIFKNFVGFEIEEAQAHGAAPEYSFEMAFASAAAETFLGIERDNGMPAFPDSFAGRVAAEADAVADGPHAKQFVQCAARGGNSRGHHIGVIKYADLGSGEFSGEGGRQGCLQGKSLDLMQVWRILDDTVSDDAGKTDANGFDFCSIGYFFDLLADTIDNAFSGHGLQRVPGLRFLRIDVQRANHLVGLDEAYGDMFHDQHTHCLAHLAPANLKSSKSRAIDSSLERGYVLVSLFRPLNAAAL